MILPLGRPVSRCICSYCKKKKKKTKEAQTTRLRSQSIKSSFSPTSVAETVSTVLDSTTRKISSFFVVVGFGLFCFIKDERGTNYQTSIAVNKAVAWTDFRSRDRIYCPWFYHSEDQFLSRWYLFLLWNSREREKINQRRKGHKLPDFDRSH